MSIYQLSIYVRCVHLSDLSIYVCGINGQWLSAHGAHPDAVVGEPSYQICPSMCVVLVDNHSVHMGRTPTPLLAKPPKMYIDSSPALPFKVWFSVEIVEGLV